MNISEDWPSQVSLWQINRTSSVHGRLAIKEIYKNLKLAIARRQLDLTSALSIHISKFKPCSYIPWSCGCQRFSSRFENNKSCQNRKQSPGRQHAPEVESDVEVERNQPHSNKRHSLKTRNRILIIYH